MSERKPFEIRIGEREIQLTLGRCACVLFRENPEVDYLTVTLDDVEESSILRIFNNVDFVRWLAGYRLERDDDGDIVRPVTTLNGDTFRGLHGWNPVTIEKNSPTEEEIEMWMDIQTRGMEKEWDQWEQS